MRGSNLSKTERKLLGALLQLSDDDGNVSVPNMKTIAIKMEYKGMGGAISYALKMLEILNMIVVTKKPSTQEKNYIIRVLL